MATKEEKLMQLCFNQEEWQHLSKQTEFLDKLKAVSTLDDFEEVVNFGNKMLLKWKKKKSGRIKRSS
ncbi:MAG: hypothetical protein H0X66_13345 [Verrucomicrobia bacterium]|nr:hypothetical protein [Verrucomicrobiota bacterium]